MSLLRLSSAALLTVCAALAQTQGVLIRAPFRSLPSVVVPPDPNEPVTGVVQTLTAQPDRSSALALMTRARLKLQLHSPRTPSFVISATSFRMYGLMPYKLAGTASPLTPETGMSRKL